MAQRFPTSGPSPAPPAGGMPPQQRYPGPAQPQGSPMPPRPYSGPTFPVLLYSHTVRKSCLSKVI